MILNNYPQDLMVANYNWTIRFSLLTPVLLVIAIFLIGAGWLNSRFCGRSNTLFFNDRHAPSLFVGAILSLLLHRTSRMAFTGKNIPYRNYLLLSNINKQFRVKADWYARSVGSGPTAISQFTALKLLT